jgi:riboflavin biosynthesis pyrimidine reductase
MTKVLAGITTSVDGYVTGPDDGPGKGLGISTVGAVVGGRWTYEAGVKEAVARAVEAAGGKDVHVMGGADVIRQALEVGLVDELTIITAPVVLGGGKRSDRGCGDAAPSAIGSYPS